ncbi:hypothetical protein DC081_06645 [Ignatzschineria cameli]|uniref:Transcriptional regulator n=1 Tax=Ignatzschineria cameli TaxID=2182793 RepID=A0A2U2AQB3_9GAMM|nr:hypothetical protein DC077_07310 [Ignatzschineria cameli]PWD89458.1 hypothetical protein DC079_06935 [Ignatzschineria cameli]PWD90930.1 hypothetical protein DC081_06645 [Ignatzschineria cameli]PWD91718.1 hypothetical protein DC078_06930 [Ignatzschineria cameli]
MVSIEEIIEKAGGAEKLSIALGITRPAVLHWKSRGLKVPPIAHAEIIEAVTGIPKEEIWVDYYERLRSLQRKSNE